MQTKTFQIEGTNTALTVHLATTFWQRFRGLMLRRPLPPDQAREFARRAGALVAAGRPPCPFCGQALDPSGHICPRANGYRR